MNETEKREVHPAERIINAINTTAEVALKQGIEIGKHKSRRLIKAARSLIEVCDELGYGRGSTPRDQAIRNLKDELVANEVAP